MTPIRPITEDAVRIPSADDVIKVGGAALSWDGHNVFGSTTSIELVKSYMHEAGTVPALRERNAKLRADNKALLDENEQFRALMELACADIIFFHEQHHPFTGPEVPELPAEVSFSVMVNDLFVPAADAEGFGIEEAIPLRDVFRKAGYEGVVRWVQAKRDNMPLRPHVESRIKEKETARAAIEHSEPQ